VYNSRNNQNNQSVSPLRLALREGELESCKLIIDFLSSNYRGWCNVKFCNFIALSKNANKLADYILTKLTPESLDESLLSLSISAVLRCDYRLLSHLLLDSNPIITQVLQQNTQHLLVRAISNCRCVHFNSGIRMVINVFIIMILINN